jgi:hypothetical protein
MSKGRFLNQKLGKRTTRKIALLKARIQESGFRTGRRIQDPGFRIQAPKPGKKDSGFGIQDSRQKSAPVGTEDSSRGRKNL